MHVDGFRFDLASTLARELYAVDRLSAFFDLVQQDPVVSQVKLIAEPWDVGEGGYQVGNFPPLWSEWNGRYRDTIRDFWRGEPATLAEFGYRFTGSSDLYQADTRRPTASVNFVTAHDGFTLRRPRRRTTRSTTRPTARTTATASRTTARGTAASRARPTTRRSSPCAPASGATSSTTLLLSQGVPMILGGDELGRTQRGNNNAYCQDNEISWFDWERRRRTSSSSGAGGSPHLRRDHPVFRRRRWFQGRRIRGIEDLAWFRPDGEEMTDDDWENGYAKRRRRVPQRRRHPDAPTPTVAGSSTTASS